MIDTIISGPLIVDGSGKTPYATDLAVVKDRIALIGDLSERESVLRIDGRGLALAPGFIDANAPGDDRRLLDPRCASKVRQGVTTEIAGTGGISAAPLAGAALTQALLFARQSGIDVRWTTLAEFLDAIEDQGLAVNMATLVGLGTTRLAAHGECGGRLSEDERTFQKMLVRDAIEQGALGISSGLSKPPGCFADSRELLELAVLARTAGGARYVTELRDEGSGLLASMEEALEIGRASQTHVHCSQHRAWGRRRWGRVHASLHRIDRARTHGQSVSVDVCPYIAGLVDLARILPLHMRANGAAATLALLNDPSHAASLALTLDFEHADEWKHIWIAATGSERTSDLIGHSLADIARRRRLRPSVAAIRLLREAQATIQAFFFAMCEDDVAAILSAEFTCIGSSTAGQAIERGAGSPSLTHPAGFGCFPRIFGRFVRRKRVFEIAEAVRRMTSLPAAIFGLQDRGRIGVGLFADLVLFNPDTVVDTATYEHPFAYPRGIEAVWVNGCMVVHRGEQRPVLPGRILRGGK
ncbi:MAG TPA: amidohydrolase family protein [Candidatus Baltobacteraceae bacterium]|jgi:N-acyl-D-amino-acid deacylase|nr:amidohydrolase family protein [Candidatus Baltobacteraceae bacterium]